MSSIKSLVVLSVSGAIFCAALAHAQNSGDAQLKNWPQWRGPLGTGVAPFGDPPTEWSETKNVKWKTKIPGDGTSTPIVWENKVFVLTAVSTGKKVESQPAAAAPAEQNPPQGAPPAAQGQPGQLRGGGLRGRGGRGGLGGDKPVEVHQFVVLSLDRESGKVLWQQVAREEVPHEGFKSGDGSFASQSAITDGKHLFAFFGSRGLYAYDMDGKPEWNQDFGDMRILLSFGEGSSPALYGDTIVVNWDHENGSFIIALDKNTGKTLWKQPREEKTTWATPLIVEHQGKPQVVVPATGKIRSYDLATGNQIWECAGLTRNVIPSPVAGHGMVYCMSGYQGNSLKAIRLGKTGDLTDSDAIVWTHNKGTPYVPSPLLSEDKLYFFSKNSGVLSCFDALTGKPHYTEKALEAIRDIYASPVGANGKVYAVGRDGTAVVLKHSNDVEILATNKLDDRIDASPVVVGKELFLRGRQNLYCIAEK